jgi:hypothetical protein
MVGRDRQPRSSAHRYLVQNSDAGEKNHAPWLLDCPVPAYVPAYEAAPAGIAEIDA